MILLKVWITERRFYPVYLALAHIQTCNGFEEWAILSDDLTDLRTFDEYGHRFDLEKTFWMINRPDFNWKRAKSAITYSYCDKNYIR